MFPELPEVPEGGTTGSGLLGGGPGGDVSGSPPEEEEELGPETMPPQAKSEQANSGSKRATRMTCPTASHMPRPFSDDAMK